MRVLDYFEDLAVGLDEGVFEEQTAQKLLHAPLLAFWNLLSAVVDQFRVRNDMKTLYQETEKLSKKWNKD